MDRKFEIGILWDADKLELEKTKQELLAMAGVSLMTGADDTYVFGWARNDAEAGYLVEVMMATDGSTRAFSAARDLARGELIVLQDLQLPNPTPAEVPEPVTETITLHNPPEDTEVTDDWAKRVARARERQEEGEDD